MLFELINNFSDGYKFNNIEIQNIISKIAANEDQTIKSINLILSTDIHLNKLKKQYFQKDHYTDVISFNLEDEGDLIDGEIYISVDRIIDNANKFNCNSNEELKRIIIHGVLHLIGYNDANKEEKETMTNLENFYMSKCSQSIII
tara:strand:+ start:1209 stop:1643 length:435 start_codon:yes stop_codon:yes gene_type:complete